MDPEVLLERELELPKSCSRAFAYSRQHCLMFRLRYMDRLPELREWRFQGGIQRQTY